MPHLTLLFCFKINTNFFQTPCFFPYDTDTSNLTHSINIDKTSLTINTLLSIIVIQSIFQITKTHYFNTLWHIFSTVLAISLFFLV